jgi:hypothetical protein
MDLFNDEIDSQKVFTEALQKAKINKTVSIRGYCFI